MGKLATLGKMTAAILKTIMAPQIGREDICDAIGYIENSGTPVGSVVPDFIGQFCADITTPTAVVWYRATGPADTDWVQQGGSIATLDIALLSVGSDGIETGLTAHAGGGQASALALSAAKSVHDVDTVASANDSVALPAATGSGNVHLVKNSAAANSMQVFAVTPTTIDGVATGTGVAIAAGSGRLFVDLAAGKYISLIGA